MVPKTSEGWLDLFRDVGVDLTTARVWAPIFAEVVKPGTFSLGEAEVDDFLVQILHESKMLTKFEEDLYYRTPGRLMAVWPSRFKSLADERPYLRSPEALANKVYGGRMGNTELGWGWRHRGSGLLQLTGADNYRAVQAKTGVKVFDNPELLRKPTKEALKVVIAWWEGHIPDAIMGNITKVSVAVNGGKIGLKERIALQAKLQGALDDR